MKWSLVCLLILFTFGSARVCAASAEPSPPDLRLNRLTGDSGAEFIIHGKSVVAQRGQRMGAWTLVEIIPESVQAGSDYAVLEDYTRLNGHLILVDTHGVQIDLPKSASQQAVIRRSCISAIAAKKF
jgi:hypothetical protein